MKTQKEFLSRAPHQVLSKTILMFLVMLLVATATQAQNEANNWIFGNQGGLNFSSTTPVALSFTSNPTFNTQEGSSSISDQTGALLFYTDGRTVWNRNHQQMPNGFGLLGGSSATQSALIVPRPGSECRQYFIFTVDEMGPQKQQKLSYSLVDMSQAGGLGDVTIKNTLLKTDVSEKLAAVRHANGIDFWLMAHGFRQPNPSNPNPPVNREFYAFRVTAATTGTNLVGTEVLSTAGTAHQNSSGTQTPSAGQMKFSPNGTLIACAINTVAVEILDFNSNNGSVAQGPPRTFTSSGSLFQSYAVYAFYGLEFSPNSQLLYVSTLVAPSKLFQINFTPSTPTVSLLATGVASVYEMGQLQLAPNGNIYVARDNNNMLGVINSPSVPSAVYTASGVTLSGVNSRLGLPTMIGGNFSCAPTPTPQACCDRLAAVPYTQPNLDIDYRTFTITNLKAPVSPICSVDIVFNPPPPFVTGGGLYIDGTLIPTGTRFVSPYNRVPNAGATTISAINTVQFNLGIDYTLVPPWVGTVTFTVNHCDGSRCILSYGPWTASPPSSPSSPNVYNSTERVEGNLHVLSFQLKPRSKVVPLKWISFMLADGKGQIFAAAQPTPTEGSGRAAPIYAQEDAPTGRGSVLFKFIRPLRSDEASPMFQFVLAPDAGATRPPSVIWTTYDANGNAIERGTLSSRRGAPREARE